MEHKFTLSAENVAKAIAALRERGSLPAPVLAALLFIDSLKHKRIEIILRAIDDEPKTPKGERPT
jgi:hypothetical protein